MSLRAMSHAERATERMVGVHPQPSTSDVLVLSMKQLTLAYSHHSLGTLHFAPMHASAGLLELRTFSLRIEHPLTQPHSPATANAATLDTVWSLAVAIRLSQPRRHPGGDSGERG
jgi:hypothetical protein